MFVLGLLTCIVLRAFSAHARVVTSFNDCSQFFYNGKEPEGMDQNAKKICQMYQQGGSFYATLYSTTYKIPLYSAYTFDKDCKKDSGRLHIWHVEPQISYPQSLTEHMVPENKLSEFNFNEDQIKQFQAMSSDYIGYDRGHLNPNCFHSYDGREATFTLTNAAPMDACFNSFHWYKWETTLRSFLLNRLNSDGDDDDDVTIYIVTGTVPDANLRIPQKESPADHEWVTVPSHIWTAVCYKHHIEDEKSFSFSYMGKNQPAEPGISLMSVSNLNARLSELYSSLSNTQESVKIFDDACFGDNNKLNNVQVAFKKLTNVPGNQRLAGAKRMSSDAQNMLGAVKRATTSNSISSNVNVKLKKVTAELTFNNMHSYSTVVEDLKLFAASACLIINAKPLARNIVHDELRKREVSEGTDSVECLLVPDNQKTAADGSLCSSIVDSSGSCQCNTGSEIKPCCSSPCLYQDKLKGYWCYSGQVQMQCSPRYSLVTSKGERCKDDHPCGTYGKDYYWCYTIYDTWDYCSPPLWRSKTKTGQDCHNNHACAKYNAQYLWCYTDDIGNWNTCCTSDDCYSAVNDKTCRSDHPCGKHGNDYLWCYMDYEENWDYCCTDCSQKMFITMIT